MSNNRASLLAGLRTGGVVRSPSVNATDSLHYAPRTAAVDGHFNPPPFMGMGEIYAKYDQPDFNDQISEYNFPPPSAPATQNAFLQQQQFQLSQQQILQARVQAQAAVQNAILGGRPNRMVSLDQQQQALQAQMELLKLQQAYQDQRQQQQLMMLQAQALLSPSPVKNVQARRLSSQVPASAAPTVTSFGQNRNSSYNADTTTGAELGTPFPKRERSVSSALNPNAASFELRSSPPKKAAVPASAAATNWRSSSVSADKSTRTNGASEPLSGRTALGVIPTTASPAKHQGAASWRRPTVNRQDSESKVSNSSSPTSTPPTVYVSTPEETSPSGSPTEASHQVPEQAQGTRNRPPSLRFSIAAPGSTTPSKHTRDASFHSNDGSQVLFAPGGNAEDTDQAPLTAREEASRRLYEGLGIGRPAPAQHANGAMTAVVGGRFDNLGDAATRNYSLPSRQPRGPPASVEELGNRNFASRIRHKALGALLTARDRRSSAVVEAF